MSNIKRTIILLYIVLVASSLYGCKKFLDAKPDSKLVVPSTVGDVQALLDYYPRVNNFGASACESSADNYYLTDADWSALTNPDNQRMYIWGKDHLFTTSPNTWGQLYDVINIANTSLLSLSSIERSSANAADWDNAKGQALYLRSQSFLQAAAIWCLAYDPNTASTDLGLPLRLDPDFNKPSVRSSVAATYQQIITDLNIAIRLLPVKPLQVMRSSKPAAYALLARTYLFMRDYNKAGLHADSCLQLNSTLIDYNTLSATATFPFKQFNAEVLVENFVPVPPNLSKVRAKIVADLYNSYSSNDLRKSVFFSKNSDGSFGFKGSYEGSNGLFGGIATDEVYLIRAECAARQGNATQAMTDLNTLLKTRYSNKIVYTPLSAATANDALNIILVERRKELLYRCLRWMDLKRLNKVGANITLTRTVNGQTYTLPPNDPKYALPIPEDVIALSGMPQNPR
ncbi:RagB/SusD domain-containing protein [Mucilaginibacter gracilis]|uniref:RagB/SusD domain-containing protein n=1 Tax=Mucilaginibacter gracilis TaxID=423350 RepID=A0A495J689_9SPHI|nr:RagB/SusD domain-containing protein [Mucilaginibacter gracilis]